MAPASGPGDNEESAADNDAVGRRGSDAARRVQDAERRADEAEQRLREQSLRAAETEHKIKTDLTVILGWSNLLMELGGSEEARTGLEAIRRSAERMAGEAERHLAEMRAELSTEGLLPEDLDLSEILRYTVGDWSTRPENPVGFNGQDGVQVWADPGALQQVLGHLIDNAIRHSPAGTRVMVSCRPGAAGMTEIEVADSGPGVPEDIDIFAPFVQAGPSARSEGGIGLFVVRRLVTAMGGKVSAERRAEGGSRFMVALPAGPTAVGQLAPARVDLTEEIVTYSGMPCLLLDGGRLAYANPAALFLLGRSWAEVRGVRLSELPGQGWGQLATAVSEVENREAPGTIDLAPDVWDAAVRRTVGISVDADQPVRRFECAVHPGQGRAVVIWMLDTSAARPFPGHSAHPGLTDATTGLPDRRLALDRLAQALTRARRSSPSVGVFVIDITNLDALGRDHGPATRESVLAAAARALGRVVRPGDMVARLDDDRLLVVCENLNGVRALDAVRGRIEAAVSGPAMVEGAMYTIGGVVGAAMADAQAAAGAGPEALIEAAAQEGRSECRLA